MKTYQEILDERTLMRRAASKKSGTMPIPGSEGAARKDVSRAGFRRKGPIQKPEVEKSGTDVPIWVRTHKSPAEYAAHITKQKHKEGDKIDVKALRKQLHKTGATKDSEVHDITVGSPKSKVKEPGQRARQFVGALKTVAAKMKEKKGVATNTPTAISSGGKKRKRSDEEGAEQRGRIYKKLGMGERDPKTGVQMAKLGEGKTFSQFLEEAYLIEGRRFVSKDEAQAKLDKMSPEERDKRVLRNSGANQGGWGTKLRDSLKKQRKRRSQRLNPLTRDELESHAKRTLRKNPSELSDIALDREEDARKKQRAAKKRLTKKTGIKHVEDHIQPLQQDKRRPENRQRFERLSPGDVESNLQVTSEPKNLRKGSKLPKKGQRGYGTTRSGAIKRRLDKAQRFSDRLDSLISQVRKN